jgi:hypothetical protein
MLIVLAAPVVVNAGIAMPEPRNCRGQEPTKLMLMLLLLRAMAAEFLMKMRLSLVYIPTDALGKIRQMPRQQLVNPRILTLSAVNGGTWSLVTNMMWGQTDGTTSVPGA